MKRILMIIASSVIWYSVNAQDLTQIKLDEFLCCNLHKVLSTISEKYNIRFAYDVEKFKTFEYLEHPINMPFMFFLKQICEVNNLKYYMDSGQVIHLVDRWQEVDKSEIAKEKRYEGISGKQNLTVSGRIFDQESHEPLPFVNVYIRGTTNGSTGNVEGYFTLLNVPYDTSTIKISYIGYEDKELQITPEMDVFNLKIELKKDYINLNDVTITADRQEILQMSSTNSSIIKMSPIKLNSLPNVGEKDIMRSFQLMPGISAANEHSSGLYVRGSTPDQVLVQYDDFTLYNVEHLFGFFSAFNSNVIKDIQLYKGGFDTKFGGRLASVVEITGKEGDTKEFNGAADISLMSANGFVEFPIGKKKKTTAIFAGRRSWQSGLYQKIFDQFADNKNTPTPVTMPGRGPRGFSMQTEQDTKSYFYDMNAKITYRPNEKNTIGFSFYRGKDDLDNSISPPSSGFGGFRNINLNNKDLMYWGNTGASIKWASRINPKLYLKISGSYSNYFSYAERSTSGGFTSRDGGIGSISHGNIEDNNLADITAKADFEYKLTENNQIEFGTQYSQYDIDYNYTQNDTFNVIDRSTYGQLYSGYLQDKINLAGNRLTVTPGIRYNYFTGTGKSYYEPRINFMYKLNENIHLKGATGRYYQFAKRVIREDITQGSRDFWVLSDNKNLPVSGSDQYILGISYDMGDYLFDVESFYKKLYNVTEYSLRFQPVRQIGRDVSTEYSENFFTGKGIAKGIDILAQKKYGDFNGWLAYTWSQVTNHIEEFGNFDFYAANDVTHEFKAIVMYKWKKWDLGTNWIYTTGRPFTEPEGYYDLTLLDGTTASYINSTVKNGKRFPSYHRLDISATFHFQVHRKNPATIGLSLFNIYNRRNVWYSKYEIVNNEVITTPVYYLGITPNINITIKLR